MTCLQKTESRGVRRRGEGGTIWIGITAIDLSCLSLRIEASSNGARRRLIHVCHAACTIYMCRVGTLRPGDFLVRFSTGTGTLGARTLPLPLLLVRHEGVRERDVVRFGIKSIRGIDSLTLARRTPQIFIRKLT